MTETVSQMFFQMSKLRPRSLEWAWDGLVPMGKLTLMTGDPGSGKSLVSLQVAAMVSRGMTTPPVSPNPMVSSTGAPVNGVQPKRASGRGVLVFSAADQAEDTVLPRLIAAGADASQVFFFKGYMLHESFEECDDDELPDENVPRVRPFLLSRDMDHLQFCLEELAEVGIDVGLIVIDSIDRYIGTSEKKSDRIEVVAQLADLAARSGVAVLVTANTSMKAGSRGGTVVYQELLNTARSVLMVAEDPEQPDRRLVVPVKHNLTARPQGVSFSVEQGVVRWGTEPLDPGVADRVGQGRWNLKQPLHRDNIHELDRAVSWLHEELEGGSVSADLVQSRATHVDISYGTLRRAAKMLDCKVRKQKHHWIWSLPESLECRADETGPVGGAGVCPRFEDGPDWGEVPDSEDGGGVLMREKVLIS